MRKLKGITINGEWLGDNVVINANFRAICNIAPFIMQEFAKLVNSINELDSAVAINNFYFPDNNTVDIEFSNNEFEGSANLNFRLNAGVPELVDRKLTIYTDENFVTPAIENDELNEGENLVSDEISADVVENVESTENPEIAQTDEEQVDEVLIDEEIEEDEENTEVAEVQEISETAETAEITEITDELDNKEEKVRVDGKVLAQALTEAVKNLPLTNNANNVAETNKPEKLETQQYAEQPSFNQEVSQGFDEPIEKAAKDNASKELSQKSEEQQFSNNENFESAQTPAAAQAPIASNNDAIEDMSVTSETQKDETISSISNDTSFDIEENEQEDLNQAEQAEEAQAQEILAENEEEVDEEVEEDLKNETEQEELTTEQEEDIQDCLADFYDNVVPETTSNDIEVDTSTVQSLLDEITNLKEELNKKEDAKEPTIDEILDSIAKKNNCCNDTYLDFSIMSSDERIDANAVNKELFIAGDKLYKWGDTLYLNE